MRTWLFILLFTGLGVNCFGQKSYCPKCDSGVIVRVKNISHKTIDELSLLTTEKNPKYFVFRDIKPNDSTTYTCLPSLHIAMSQYILEYNIRLKKSKITRLSRVSDGCYTCKEKPGSIFTILISNASHVDRRAHLKCSIKVIKDN